MKIHQATLRRMTAMTLSLFLAVGLGLIGPASALADGVERGGLNFTIVSDDISKSANGSVPEVQANTSSSADAAGGTSATQDPSSSGDPAPGSTGEPAAPDPAPDPASDPASDPAPDPAPDDGSQTSAELNAKGNANNSNGKKSGQR